MPGVSDPLLIPRPWRMRPRSGQVFLKFGPEPLRTLAGFDPEAARVLRTAITRIATPEPSRLSDSPGAPQFEVKIRPLPFSPSVEAYRVTLAPDRMVLEGASPRGLFYASQTLRSLIQQYGRVLPCMTIEDFPRYPLRGFLYDVSRGKVPRRSTLFALIERLASLKYNQLQLYIEHTFAFRKHPLIGRGHSPLTPDDLRALGQHCRKHHIDFVPCLQSFGHVSHVLGHAEYAHLAESDFRGGWTLSPAEPGTYRLLEDLYAEFLPCFPEGLPLNACCDETWDLGRGKTRQRVEHSGLGAVYVDHLKKVRRIAKRHGRRTFFWADILEKHPERVEGLPRDVGLLYWNYDAFGSVGQATRRLRRLMNTGAGGGPDLSGRELWVCPGTSAWNSLFFRRENAEANIYETARAGAQAGATGFLLTDWGDNGHYNFLSNSLWPMAFGTECAWHNPSRRPDSEEFDRAFLFSVLGSSDKAWTEAGRLLGGLAGEFGVAVLNHSPERWLLTGAPSADEDILGVGKMIKPYEKIRTTRLRRAASRAERAAARLVSLRDLNPDLELVREEWLLSARLASFACRRALLQRNSPENGDSASSLRKESLLLATRFETLWLARNRRSDLDRIRKDFRRVAESLRVKAP